MGSQRVLKKKTASQWEASKQRTPSSLPLVVLFKTFFIPRQLEECAKLERATCSMVVIRVAGHREKDEPVLTKPVFGEPVWSGFFVQFFCGAKMAIT